MDEFGVQEMPTFELHSRLHGPMTMQFAIDKPKKYPTTKRLPIPTRAQLTMSFSFGFSGDDIEHDPADIASNEQNVADVAQDAPPPIPARAHDLDELVGKA